MRSIRLSKFAPFIVLTALWSCLAEGVAQDIRFERLDVEHGLSQSSVYSIIQDSRGFMWVGTSDGLNRYDGHTFKTYTKEISDATSLSVNWIETLLEDHTGLIWVGTNVGGVNLFDPVTERFSRLMHDPENPHSLSDNSIRVIYEDREGTVWLGTNDGLNRYDRETGRFTRFVADSLDANSISSNYVTSIHQDHAGMLWIGTEIGGLNRFDPSRKAFTHVLYDPENPSGLSGQSIRAILEDDAGNLWISVAYSGLLRLDKARQHVTAFQHDPEDPHSLSDNDVWNIAQDRRGRLWFATRVNGISVFDPRTGLFARHVSDPDDPGSLSSSEVNTIYEDRSGLIWVGTGRGINTFDPHGKPFKRVIIEREVDQKDVNDNSIWAIYQDRSRALWIGTGNGLFRSVENEGGHVQFMHFQHDPEDPYSLSHREVFAIHASSDGTLWIGTADGLNELAPDQQAVRPGHRVRFTRWLQPDVVLPGIRNNQVFSIVDDPDSPDILWLATARGLIRFNRKATGPHRYTVYNSDPGNPLGLQTGEIRTLLFDRTGLLWIGTRTGGLYRYDRFNDQFTRFAHDPDDPGSLSHNAVRSLYEDRGGKLWIGTDFGLNRFDPSLNQFETFTQRDGLPNDVIWGILPDAEGHLWLSTLHGLSQFDPVGKTSRNFTTSDGLAHAAFNRGAYFKAETGEMFFGSIEGITMFHPDRIRLNAFVPPIVITSLRRYNVAGDDEQLTVERGIPWKSEVELSYRDIVLTFEFAALSFRNPSDNQYAYRLVGYHDQWIYLGNERSVTFTNLDPGAYTLQVKGSNDDGVWNEEGTSLRLFITPPPWKTWWAYGLYALALGALFFTARRYELARMRLKTRLEHQHAVAENLRELDQMKSRFFANVSHEFRTPLTLILGPLDDLKTGFYGPLTAPVVQQVELARRNAGRVLDLINQILDVARLEAGRTPLRARPLDLGAFVEGVAQPFQAPAARTAMTFDVVLPAAPVEVFADPPQLEKVIANLLANAFKFTPEAGTIRVMVAAEDGTAYVAVRDSGPGIPAADLPHVFDRFYQVNEAAQTQLGTGIGLALAKEVVDLHGGALTVQSEEGFGSMFTVTLPLGQAHLAPEQVVEDAGPWTPGEALTALSAGPTGDGLGGEQNDAIQTPDDVTTVLVVEDYPEVRAYVRRHLEAAPEGSLAYRVLEAADGEAGLALAKARLPDIVLSDVMMPKLDGFGLCRALKADPETDFIPVILLTAKAAPEDKLDGLGEHADDYLTKPFDVAELRARIANLIAGRTRLRERFRQEGMALVLGDDAPAPMRFRAPEAVTSATDVFLERVCEAIEAHFSDDTFSVQRLAEAAGVSRGHLHRQLKAFLGQTPTDLIRTMRLERAAHLLAGRAGTVSEIAYAVGFKSVGHFSDSFVQAYGCRPSAYAAREGTAEDETA